MQVRRMCAPLPPTYPLPLRGAGSRNLLNAAAFATLHRPKNKKYCWLATHHPIKTLKNTLNKGRWGMGGEGYRAGRDEKASGSQLADGLEPPGCGALGLKRGQNRKMNQSLFPAFLHLPDFLSLLENMIRFFFAFFDFWPFGHFRLCSLFISKRESDGNTGRAGPGWGTLPCLVRCFKAPFSSVVTKHQRWDRPETSETP